MHSIRLWTLVITLMLVSIGSIGQVNIKIVSSNDGTGIPFANISNKTKKIMVACDAEGHASISASEGDTLVVSHISHGSKEITWRAGKFPYLTLEVSSTVLFPTIVGSCER